MFHHRNRKRNRNLARINTQTLTTSRQKFFFQLPLDRSFFFMDLQSLFSFPICPLCYVLWLFVNRSDKTTKHIDIGTHHKSNSKQNQNKRKSENASVRLTHEMFSSQPTIFFVFFLSILDLVRYHPPVDFVTQIQFECDISHWIELHKLPHSPYNEIL